MSEIRPENKRTITEAEAKFMLEAAFDDMFDYYEGDLETVKAIELPPAS